jgi:hypothetical protein
MDNHTAVPESSAMYLDLASRTAGPRTTACLQRLLVGSPTRSRAMSFLQRPAPTARSGRCRHAG